jgi:hypothetical protein
MGGMTKVCRNKTRQKPLARNKQIHCQEFSFQVRKPFPLEDGSFRQHLKVHG